MLGNGPFGSSGRVTLYSLNEKESLRSWNYLLPRNVIALSVYCGRCRPKQKPRWRAQHHGNKSGERQSDYTPPGNLGPRPSTEVYQGTRYLARNDESNNRLEHTINCGRIDCDAATSVSGIWCFGRSIDLNQKEISWITPLQQSIHISVERSAPSIEFE